MALVPRRRSAAGMSGTHDPAAVAAPADTSGPEGSRMTSLA